MLMIVEKHLWSEASRGKIWAKGRHRISQSHDLLVHPHGWEPEYGIDVSTHGITCVWTVSGNKPKQWMTFSLRFSTLGLWALRPLLSVGCGVVSTHTNSKAYVRNGIFSSNLTISRKQNDGLSSQNKSERSQEVFTFGTWFGHSMSTNDSRVHISSDELIVLICLMLGECRSSWVRN